MRNASETDIRQLPHGTFFVAMAISAASAYGPSKEEKLLEYAQVVTERGLDANDGHNGNSAIVLACYHNYRRLVDYLLELGCSLDSRGIYGSALEACVRNGQHEALELLFQRRPQDVAALVGNDTCSMTLRRAIYKRDIVSVRILVKNGIVKPTMSDGLVAKMKERGQHVRYLFPVLRLVYPNLQNVASWNKQIHWSFPTSDRHTINLLWYTAGANGRVFPTEIWLYIFSFVGRGWFARETLPPAI